MRELLTDEGYELDDAEDDFLDNDEEEAARPKKQRME
jgi:hypothetical protein